MAAIPNTFLEGTTNFLEGLSPLQLAYANILFAGGDPSLFVNPEFLTEMKQFADSAQVEPVNVVTGSIGVPKVEKPIIASGITGNSFVVIGDTVYVQRVAQDCGPDEELRYELVKIGNKFEVAEGTFAVYGKIIYGGIAANAMAQPDNSNYGI